MPSETQNKPKVYRISPNATRQCGQLLEPKAPYSKTGKNRLHAWLMGPGTVVVAPVYAPDPEKEVNRQLRKLKIEECRDLRQLRSKRPQERDLAQIEKWAEKIRSLRAERSRLEDEQQQQRRQQQGKASV
ncbi:hypothetical protein AbraIFM66950_007972 [Aspergillus brasiliensis]|nr:hypothetical protein AbraIFM66950_007972 [Aspergillus brasiliensis]